MHPAIGGYDEAIDSWGSEDKDFYWRLENAGIKKKSVVSFIGNVLLIKNANPLKRDSVRRVDFLSERTYHATFINHVWRAIYLGVLKTIGLPASFADKPY